jgi:hypothetical protein
MALVATLFQALSRPVVTTQSELEHEPRQTLTFADILAASAFLDFGGIPDERWNNAWCAAQEHDRFPENEQVHSPRRASCRLVGSDQTIARPQPTQLALRPLALKKKARGLDAMKHVYVRPDNRASVLSNDGTHRGLRAHLTGWSVLNVAMFIAAFGFVTFVVMFGCPPSRPTGWREPSMPSGRR